MMIPNIWKNKECSWFIDNLFSTSLSNLDRSPSLSLRLINDLLMLISMRFVNDLSRLDEIGGYPLIHFEAALSLSGV